MLIILSEINNLEYYKAHGIYPDEFYTDLNIFKDNAVHFEDAYILVVFAGITKFKKKLVVEEIKNLQVRARDKNDIGIRSVITLTDNTLESLDYYYQYHGNLRNCQLKSKWTVKQENVDILYHLLQILPDANKREHECKVFVVEFELTDEVKQKIIADMQKGLSKEEKELLPRIKIVSAPKYE